MTKYLDDDELDELVEQASNSNLATQRVMLLAGVPPNFAGTIPLGVGPTAQLRIDLAFLNTTEPLLDKSIPIRRWLKNAISFLRGTAAEPIFVEKLRTVDERIAAAWDLDAGAL